MKTPLLALALVAFALPVGCKTDETPPDPLATRGGFCDAWAHNACPPDVIEYCNAPSAGACESTQSDFCRGILPENYSSEHATACLNAVKAAYKDGDLTAAEIQVVLKLGAPCDQLSKGISGDGESCAQNDDCATANGYGCVKKLGAAEGVCAKPEVVGPGEACDEPAQVCGDGNFCNGENCIAYRKTGGACEGDYQCRPEDYCVLDDTLDPPTGTCEVRGAASSTCRRDDDCQSHYCMVASDETEGLCASRIRLSINEPLCDNLR